MNTTQVVTYTLLGATFIGGGIWLYNMYSRSEEKLKEAEEKTEEAEEGFDPEPDWKFTNNHWLSGAKVGFIGPKKPPKWLKEGVMVEIKQDPGFTNSEYNTTTEVKGIKEKNDKYIVETGLDWAGNTGKEGGKIKLI